MRLPPAAAVFLALTFLGSAVAADNEPLAVIESILIGGEPAETTAAGQLEVVRAASGTAEAGTTGLDLYADDELRSNEEVRVVLRYFEGGQTSFADVLVDFDTEVRIRDRKAVGLSFGRILAMLDGFFEVFLPDESTLGAEGTEFEVWVDPEGDAELLVLDGQVGIRRPQAQPAAVASPPPAGTGAFWGFPIQTGEIIRTRAAVPTHNPCPRVQEFGAKSSGMLPWFAAGSLEPLFVQVGDLDFLKLGLSIDATDVAAGTYRDEIAVFCVDCSRSGCEQEPEIIEISIEVTGETIVQPLQKTMLGKGSPPATRGVEEFEVSAALDWSSNVLIAAQPSYAAAHEPPHLANPQERGEVFRRARYDAIWRRNAASRARLGDVYSDWGEGRKAVAEYQDATETQPRSAAWFTRLGRASRQAGDLRRARRYLEAAVETDPESGSARNALGNLHMDLAAAAKEQGDIERAEAELRRSITSFQRAEQLSVGPAPVDGRREWLEGVTTANTARAQLQLGKIASQKGQLDLAAELYAASEAKLQSAIQTYPSYPFAKLELGSLNQQVGRLAVQRGDTEASRTAYAKADERYKEVISSHKDLAPAYVQRGTLLEDQATAATDPTEKQRYQQEASEEYEKSIRARPSYAPAYYQLGKASEELNEPEIAKRYYGTYLKVEQKELQEGEKANRARTWKGSPRAIGVAVPDLRGKAAGDARATLERSKLALGEVTYQATREAEPGTVFDQKPKPGEKVKAGTAVHLMIAQNPRGVQ